MAIGVGAPSVISSASGGKIYAFNDITEHSSGIVVLANPSRQRIIFHNPGANDLFIAPQFIQGPINQAPAQPTNVALAPSNAALGGCIRVYGNGGTLIITGECQGAYQAFSVTGAGDTNPLTIIDSNVA